MISKNTKMNFTFIQCSYKVSNPSVSINELVRFLASLKYKYITMHYLNPFKINLRFNTPVNQMVNVSRHTLQISFLLYNYGTHAYASSYYRFRAKPHATIVIYEYIFTEINK